MAVYILSDPGNQRIKIGFTASPTYRLKQHATSNPNLVLLALLPDGDRRCEKALHRLLQGHRCPGTTEWYWDNLMVRDALDRLVGILS